MSELGFNVPPITTGPQIKVSLVVYCVIHYTTAAPENGNANVYKRVGSHDQDVHNALVWQKNLLLQNQLTYDLET